MLWFHWYPMFARNSNVPLWNWWVWLAGQKPTALMNIKIAGNYSWIFISPEMLEVLMILMNHRVFWQSMAKSPDVASCFLTVMPTKCLGFSLRLSCSTWTMFQWDHKTVPCTIGDLHKRRYGAMVKTIHNTFTISLSKWFCLSMTMIKISQHISTWPKMDELWSMKPSILVLFFLASTDGYDSKLVTPRIGASRASPWLKLYGMVG